MTTFELIKDFQEKQADLVLAMQSSDHNDPVKKLWSNHHLEGSVWTHTLMTLQWADQLQASFLVRVALLLHDTGKPQARLLAEDKVSFIGHEGISVFSAMPYLKQLGLTTEEKIHVLELISFHTLLFRIQASKGWPKLLAQKFNQKSALLKDLILLSYCDSQGRLTTSPSYSFKEWADKFSQTFSLIDKSIIQPDEAKKQMVTALMGLPMSGKSTWLQRHTQGLKVCRDDLLLELAGHKDYGRAYREIDGVAVDALLAEKLKLAANQGENVFLDMTSLSPKARRRGFAGFNKKFKKKIVVFLTLPSILATRNERRRGLENKFLPPSVLLEMMKAFSLPHTDEADEIEYVYED